MFDIPTKKTIAKKAKNIKSHQQSDWEGSTDQVQKEAKTKSYQQDKEE